MTPLRARIGRYLGHTILSREPAHEQIRSCVTFGNGFRGLRGTEGLGLVDVDVCAARDLAASLLEGTGNRWRHTQSAAAAAAEAACTVAQEDRALLVSAAWLHDVGYGHPARPTGFHPLDGADLLLEEGWPIRLVSLVAHHSEARFEASARGLATPLEAFPREDGPVMDALIYADMTAGPAGGRVHVAERLADMRRRHAQEAAKSQIARRVREPHLLLASARVDLRLRRHPLVHHAALPGRAENDLTGVVSALEADHEERDELDVHAAVRSALSVLGSGVGTSQIRRWAAELLQVTRDATSTVERLGKDVS